MKYDNVSKMFYSLKLSIKIMITDYTWICNEWSIYVNLVHEHAYFVSSSEMILVRN